ncbi:MAG: amidohydrolase family protein, partial [Bacillota bacterium]
AGGGVHRREESSRGHLTDGSGPGPTGPANIVHTEPDGGENVRRVDLAVTGGTIITMDPERRILEDGVVLIDEGSISAVGTRTETGEFRATRTIDARGAWVLPGLIDAHGHAGHSLVKTLGDRPDGNWLEVAEEVYFRNSTESFWWAEARLAALERLRFGVTTGYSMMGNIPRVDALWPTIAHVRGVREMGIRDMLGVGPGLPPWPKRVAFWKGGGRRERETDADEALEVTREICHRAARGQFGGRITAHVSPSRVGDPVGLGKEELARQTEGFMAIARDYGLMVNSHAYGGNIEYAYHNLDGVLGPGTILAHCTGITPREVEILAETDTRVVHCPSARAVIRGWCPAVDLVESGVTVALATDGTGPDRTFDVIKEMRVAAIIHRIHEGDDGVMPPGKLLEMVTIDAAKVLGLQKRRGSLEPGKDGDITIVGSQSAYQYPEAMPIHRLVYTTTGRDVTGVVVAGKVLMERGKILGVDQEDILRTAQEEFEAMLDRSGLRGELRPHRGFWGQARLSGGEDDHP